MAAGEPDASSFSSCDGRGIAGGRTCCIWGVRQEALGEPVPVRERLFRFVNHEAYLDCYRITDGLLDRWMDVIDDIGDTIRPRRRPVRAQRADTARRAAG